MERSRINLIGAGAYFSTGGIEAVNRILLHELRAAGLLGRAYFRWDDAGAIAGTDAVYLEKNLIRPYSGDARGFVGGVLAAGIARPLDLWLCTHVNYALLGLGVCLSRSRRLAVMLHASELDDGFTRLKRFALLRAGHIFAVSEFTRKKALAVGVRASRILVLPNGVPDPCPEWRFGRFRAANESVLFVGRMDEFYKGQLDLLEAAKLLKERLRGLRLVFVGGGDLDKWRSEVARRGLEDQVEFTGRISTEELSRRYATASLFVMVSRNEGFGLVYAEAMAHGLPCIAGDGDAGREVVADGETGRCIPAGNPTALADAIHSLLRSPDMRESMGRAARLRYERNFTIGEYGKRLRIALTQWRLAAGIQA